MAGPAKPRSVSGVWRQKPAGEPPLPVTPADEAEPLELNKVIEELAALEAQFVAPAQQHEPAAPPAAPRHALPASPAGSRHEPGIVPEEALLVSNPVPDPVPDPVPNPVPNPVPHHAPHHAANPAPGAAAQQEPVFDFTPPSPAPAVANPFTPASSGLTRSRGRYLLWAAGLLAVALLVQGGRWFYQERNDAESLALIAGEAKQAPRTDQSVKPPALAAQEAVPAPEAEAPAVPATPASQAAPGVPPLVMLKPDPPVAGKGKQSSSSAASETAPPTAPQPERAVQKKPASPSSKPASPSPKPVARMARASSDKAAEPARKTRKSEPATRPVRASAAGKEKPSGQEDSLAATLKACREHGYHATQCIKRDCRVTQYGFACRGQ